MLYDTRMQRGYPMYQMLKKHPKNLSDVSVVADKPLQVGDQIIIAELGKIFLHTIKDISEERVARGKHKEPKIFQKLICEYSSLQNATQE